ncbi:unnamed protein product [Medioppia subpectinata]|uniref:Uncharacterized protein n=1 Tax=Medioppia subpectinata TaxID=1979941 RepID=A0A7R9Q2H6_9ACAR|nr:unnamed protein product [Medioppia subpectinata]CAG2109438.1 unnamed protein product [Medioppia subpectinata]
MNLLRRIQTTFSRNPVSYVKYLLPNFTNLRNTVKMPFLDAFIKEVMRVNCSVTRIERHYD